MLGKEAYDDRRDRYIARVKSVLDYAQEENFCRSQVLLTYFGEKNTKACGKCDICLKKKETTLSDDEFEIIKSLIIDTLKEEALTINALTKKINHKEAKTIQVIRFLLDNGLVAENNLMKLFVIQ